MIILHWLKGLKAKNKSFTKRANMNDFLEQVKKLAIKDGKSFYRVKLEIDKHISDNNHTIKFICYIDGYNHSCGSTIEESYNKLYEQIYPMKQYINIDISKITID